MAKAKAPASQPENESVEVGLDSMPGLRITAAREGFRRAGWRWSSQPTTVPLSEFTDDQVAMLRAEAMLMVEEVTIEGVTIEAAAE